MLGRLFFAPSDEVKYETKAALDILKGIKTPADFSDKSEYKLLENTVLTIKETKMLPYDQLDISYWNQDSGSFKRSYSLLVGGRNFYDPNIQKVRSRIYRPGDGMETTWAKLSKLENDEFFKIILGVAPIESFDHFVTKWREQGGDQISAEINNSE
ncbi:hypothetical protein D3C77_472880 [compost metagenome]